MAGTGLVLRDPRSLVRNRPRGLKTSMRAQCGEDGKAMAPPTTVGGWTPSYLRRPPESRQEPTQGLQFPLYRFIAGLAVRHDLPRPGRWPQYEPTWRESCATFFLSVCS